MLMCGNRLKWEKVEEGHWSEGICAIQVRVIDGQEQAGSDGGGGQILGYILKDSWLDLMTGLDGDGGR